MVDPVTMAAVGTGMGVGGSLLSSIGQKEMNAKKRAQIREIVKKLENNWMNPEFDESPITREEYRVLEEYVPEAASFVEERYPKIVEGKKAAKYSRAQQDALKQLQREALTGKDAIADAARERSFQEAKAREQGLRQQAISRLSSAGLATPESRMAAELGAAGDASSVARQQSMQAEAEAQARRSQARAQATQLAGNLYGQEMNKEQSAADVINAFNQRGVQRRQAHLNQIAQERNRAQQVNQGRRQAAADANTQAINALRQYEQQRRDKYAQSKADYNNQLLSTTAGLEGNAPIDAPWWATVGTGVARAGVPVATAGFQQMAKAPPTSNVPPPPEPVSLTDEEARSRNLIDTQYNV